jgi:hypothetical protein
MIPEGDRLNLVRKLLGEPEELRRDLLQVLREVRWQHSGKSDRELLALLDRDFYAALDQIPGARGRDLCGGWWERGVVPMLRTLNLEGVDRGD